ncbi:hypothetical protein LSUE1_G002364 [Lachnellula suecica]|uniref:DUF427 domain-containing protein n=1 Tax=Lachnellula suecica TaxID=602035 RepID=A0A8T9CFD6_9HELO|nr:hypothetical protein LSUE1_G002364 [Lachnellula suecica]
MADLETLATNLISSGPHKVESTPRRVRALFEGVWLFDTTSARHVWEHKYFPQFWVPIEAVNPGILTKGEAFDSEGSAFRAEAKGKGKTTPRVLIFEQGPLAGLVRFEFKAMVDAWFEEDQQIYDHPKNPYTRIDILPSSRKVTVKIGGVAIAECANPAFLFETGLRTRFYLPKTSVQWQYLSESKTTSKCPYKGLANYYNVTVDGKEYPDAVWWYEYPTTESSAIQGLVCFYNEKVDTYVDGVLEEK